MSCKTLSFNPFLLGVFVMLGIMGCTPLSQRLVSPEEATRQAAIASYESLPLEEQNELQGELAEIAKTHPDLQTCQYAQTHVTRLEHLIDIAKHANHLSVRYAVALRITDPALAEELFASIAMTPTDPDLALTDLVRYCGEVDVLRCSAERLQQTPTLLKVLNATNEESICNIIAKKINDPEIIHTIVTTSPNIKARKVFIKKITEVKTLLACLEYEPDTALCLTLLQQLKDHPELLVKYAAADKNTIVRFEALRLIQHRQDLLVEVIKTSPYDPICTTAMTKLQDPAAFAVIATTHPKANIRSAAIRKVTDQPTLATILQNDADVKNQHEALKRLRDAATVQPALIKIVTTPNQKRDFRLLAISKLTDQPTLIEVIKNDWDATVKSTALKNVTDQAFLKEIIQHDQDNNLRLIAIEQVNDKQLLETLARRDFNNIIRNKAKERLKALQ